MPELPEVETTVRGLRNRVLGRRIIDVWTDFDKMIKRPNNFKEFKKLLKRKIIKDIKRRGKNILFILSGNKIMLVHQKMTGHFLVGKWIFKRGKWISKIKGPISNDSKNYFLHLIFFLDNKKQIALSDVRKFAKVELWEKESLEKESGLKDLGPEPLENNFTFKIFEKALRRKERGKVKQVLMNQNIIAGIGNIYSDEILWQARVNPFRKVGLLNEKELKNIYRAIREILRKAIKAGGDSISDYRGVDGRRGDFGFQEKVYGKENKECFRCKKLIVRKKIGGRSAHFCLKCQK